MKLLGWMHRKFRQNSAEAFKELVIGQAGGGGGRGRIEEFVKKQVKQSDDEKEELEEYDEEASGGMYEVFHGFLAIGTLGLDPPTTPTFAISVETITEKEEEVTENELKVIQEELEKVLVVAGGGGGDIEEESSRSSHVMQDVMMMSGGGEEEEANGVVGINAICPLQGYLLGSATQTRTVGMNGKKEQRTSLGELFQRSKLGDMEVPIGVPNTNNNKDLVEKKDKSTTTAMHLMKKKLKKTIMLHTSSRPHSKLPKILDMFHRKVHPENSTVVEKPDKIQKNESKKKINDGGHNKSEGVHEEEDIVIRPKRAFAKENMRQCKRQLPDTLHFALGSEDSSENKEHWIKTDANYFVLEL